MPCLFKGARVLARGDGQGGLLLDERGLAAMVYRPHARVYSARPENLELAPEEPAPAASPAMPRAVAAAVALDGSGPATSREAARPPRPVFGQTKPPPPAAAASASAGAGAGVVAWTDGACTGNPGPAGAGVLLVVGGRRREISQYLGQGTNNIGELTAVKLALEAIDDPTQPIVVHTDSEYTIGVLTKPWKPKKNQELIAEIRQLMRRFRRLKLVKVAGHAGVPENERVDGLARRAVSSRASSDRWLD